MCAEQNDLIGNIELDPALGKITAEYDKEALKTLREADVLKMASIEE